MTIVENRGKLAPVSLQWLALWGGACASALPRRGSLGQGHLSWVRWFSDDLAVCAGAELREAQRRTCGAWIRQYCVPRGIPGEERVLKDASHLIEETIA